MSDMYPFYFLLGALLCFGAKSAGRGEWQEDFTSLRQTKILQGITALGIALHHMAQKTCAPWHPAAFTRHGLDFFVPLGYLFVGIFLFCSGLGLYKSFKTKPDYLKGFCRRRILPIVLAFYLSEIISTAVRLAMGEKMDFLHALWYLSGLHMANANAWYVVVIPFFYLAFWAAFRFCKKEGRAIVLVFLFTLAYTALGAFIDHQSDWWMQGEWWYNSILLFPLGMLFGKYEKQATAFLKKGYWVYLALSLAAVFLLFWQSEWLNEHAWGYYGEWNDPLKVPHRLMSACMQWLVAAAYTAFCFLLMMKVRLGNRVLAWLGGMTLEFYLMHGMFVEMFGYNFLDKAKSLVYIRSVPLYIAAVLGCSVPAALLFRLIWKAAVRLTGKAGRGASGGASGSNPGNAPRLRKKTSRTEPGKAGRNRRFLLAGVLLLLASGFFLPSLLPGNESVRVINGMAFSVPEHYARVYADSRYAAWEYAGADGNRPGRLILDADIRSDHAGNFSTVEQVLAACTFLTEAEVYVNPQGIRMVRGFADYSSARERRYYIESKGSVVLMCMLENEQFYDREACEEVLRRTADSVRPAI